MHAADIREKFLHYFAKKKHARVPSSSLIPNNDPTVLLTTAGMQQFLPYFLGEADPQKDFKALAATSVQKCFRTSDIDSVGDTTHLTFFEMLGNFSFGDYFKEGAIDHAFTFLTKELKLSGDKIWATVFSGDDEAGGVARDDEAIGFWRKYLPRERIAAFGRDANWWGPPGASGPCGPCSEAHYDLTGVACDKGADCKPNCDCGRFVEIWNLVFMQYHQDTKKNLKPLEKGQIDTGMGLERVTTILQNKPSIFETDLFEPLMAKLRADEAYRFEDVDRRIRIVADHLRGSIFLLADGVLFSNKEQGYILRRIFRRALDQFNELPQTLAPYVELLVKQYHEVYPELQQRQQSIIESMDGEIASYRKIVELKVEKVYKKVAKEKPAGEATDTLAGPSGRTITADEAFQLFSTYGLSLNRLKEEGYVFDEKEFTVKVEEHRAKSREGAVKKFGGHGISDESQWDPEELAKMKTYHTATHLVHEALHQVLGEHVRQEGSDINPERLRFDFRHPDKLTDEQKKRVEDMVNEQIRASLPVTHEQMTFDEAVAIGARAFFKEKYPEKVTVYSIGDFSKEICGGPHVSNTSDIKGTFKIQSEKSVAAGIRRIKAVVV